MEGMSSGQISPEALGQGATVFVMLFAAVIGLAIGIAVSVVICLFLQNDLKRIPPQYRLMEPSMVWLLLIPCFNVVWNFFVFLKIPDSFKAYFDATGQGAQVGDCGRNFGLWYSIAVVAAVVLGFVPCLGPIAGIASLVLLILALVKFNDLKNRIPPNEAPPAA